MSLKKHSHTNMKDNCRMTTKYNHTEKLVIRQKNTCTVCSNSQRQLQLCNDARTALSQITDLCVLMASSVARQPQQQQQQRQSSIASVIDATVRQRSTRLAHFFLFITASTSASRKLYLSNRASGNSR